MHLEWITLALLVLLVALILWLAFRGTDPRPLRELGQELSAAVRDPVQRLERELRDEVARSATVTRQELAQSLGTFQQTLLAQQGDVARTQNEQIDSFRSQLAATQANLAETLRHSTTALTQQASSAREAQDATLGRLAEAQTMALSRVAEQQTGALGTHAEQQALALKRFSDTLGEQLRTLAQSNDQRMTEVRVAVEQKLAAIQADNEKKLEQMRATVDEKLHATLEQRLGESFKLVADRLDTVHRGLNEMQMLAKDVGQLNRVLTNVKSRGIFGEVQLAGLLEQVFTPEQYALNVETVPGSGARVEFAIKLPGRRDDGVPLWLPIDAKFPREDYERLLDALERADTPEAVAAGRAIEQRLRLEARTIREKYVAPPHTTEFAILFVPTEGLYAEALRRPGLMEALQREHRVTLAGPTTLLATLTSLQMGFRTLALEKRSAEVWEVLGAVKTEFGKFGDVLARTKKKLDEASSSIDLAQTRTNVMTRKLKSVEALSQTRAHALLPGAEGDTSEAAAEPSDASRAADIEPS
jgi:DNA recombination protein RmuC